MFFLRGVEERFAQKDEERVHLASGREAGATAVISERG